jgi:hypothetical protein
MKVSKEYIAELGKVALISTDNDSIKLKKDIARTLEAGETLSEVVGGIPLCPTFQILHEGKNYYDAEADHPIVDISQIISNMENNLVVVTNEKSKESNE